MNLSTPHSIQAPKKENLRIMTINCRRIFDKKAEFSTVMDYVIVKPHLVCTTETRLNGVKPGKPPDTNAIKPSEVFPPDYASYRNDRGALGGGVFILANENLVSGKIPEASDPDEVIWTKVQTQGNKELYVGSFYMPHRQKAHLDCLDRSLQKITVID